MTYTVPGKIVDRRYPEDPRSPCGYEYYKDIVNWEGDPRGIHFVQLHHLRTYGYDLDSEHIFIKGRKLRKIGEDRPRAAGLYVPDRWPSWVWHVVRKRTVDTVGLVSFRMLMTLTIWNLYRACDRFEEPTWRGFFKEVRARCPRLRH